MAQTKLSKKCKHWLFYNIRLEAQACLVIQLHKTLFQFLLSFSCLDKIKNDTILTVDFVQSTNSNKTTKIHMTHSKAE
jgi:hypothetical protein